MSIHEPSSAAPRILEGDKIKPITPEVIAELFCDLSSDQQAAFFNHVDSVASTWKSDLCFQLQYITDEDGLTLAGRRVMQQIGEYSHWGLVPHLSVRA
jgi:hypothetical protein